MCLSVTQESHRRGLSSVWLSGHQKNKRFTPGLNSLTILVILWLKKFRCNVPKCNQQDESLPLLWKSWECSLNSSKIAASSSYGLTNTSCCRYFCAPDDGWGIHSKRVEQFTEIKKLCNVASCWLYFGTFLRCTDPWTLNSVISYTMFLL